MGKSVKKIVDMNPKAAYLNNMKGIYCTTDYIIFPSLETKEIYVFLRESAKSESVLCAYFHSILLAIIIYAINEVPLVCKL